MPTLKHQKTRTLHIRPNGRSADFIAPNFIYGCAGGCRNSYCYVMRYNFENVYINDNCDQILQAIEKHAIDLPFPKPKNQTDSSFWTYDIGCSTDVVLHWKHYDWLKVFDFFHDHPKIKATFATKYVNNSLLNYTPAQKIRIRFSLMPQAISSILEPHTSLIHDRIAAINDFSSAGYDVHINFSPIVIYDHWLEDYAMLFRMIDKELPESIKQFIYAECVFLTHNQWQHERNLINNKSPSEELLWQPNLQESKVSEYNSEGVRYRRGLKAKFIRQWTQLHHEIIPWNSIRYIF